MIGVRIKNAVSRVLILKRQKKQFYDLNTAYITTEEPSKHPIHRYKNLIPPTNRPNKVHTPPHHPSHPPRTRPMLITSTKISNSPPPTNVSHHPVIGELEWSWLFRGGVQDLGEVLGLLEGDLGCAWEGAVFDGPTVTEDVDAVE